MDRLIECLLVVAGELKADREQRHTEHEWMKTHFGLVSRRDLHDTESRLTQLAQIIMSKISDFAAAQAAFNTRLAADIDSLVASQAGLTADVKSLNDQIAALQASQGGITPEDQALLDDLQAKGAALADRQDAVAAALAALDAQTPPAVPVAPTA